MVGWKYAANSAIWYDPEIKMAYSINIYDLSFIKWPRHYQGQFWGYIWPWFEWKYVMNIRSNQIFVKYYAKNMFDAY